MRVGRKIALVGGIPILIAAAIAAAGWTLMSQEERARGGAILASGIYHDLDLAGRVRDRYVTAPAGERGAFAEEFTNLIRRADAGLGQLRRFTRTGEQAARIASAQGALARYVAQMDAFIKVTRETDARMTDMDRRAGTLVDLVERARLRQQGSNTDLARSLTERIEALRRSRDIVSGLHAVRTGAIEAALERLRGDDRNRTLRLGQMQGASSALSNALHAEGRERDADELASLTGALDVGRKAADGYFEDKLAELAERLLKVDASNQQTVHDEVAQLLTYSVQANETEQATQNVAVSTLKLGQRTSGALRHRDPDLAAGMLGEGERLAKDARALPISPLIQSEMVQALVGWRERLSMTILGLRHQNEMIAAMDRVAAEMRDSARSLNDTFIGDAERVGTFLQRLLAAGAAVGLTVGIVVAVFVARSILVPLRALQAGMIAMAADPAAAAAPVAGVGRRDELGDIARATAFFVSEITRREAALRRAKDRADVALEDLRRTQDDLVRAEKLASLGQLVAGVAHEINTPLGIALTTATSVRDETRGFRAQVIGGTLSKARLTGFLGRIEEGTGLLCANLARATDLVHGFKQVAVDRVSDERRNVRLSSWLEDLVASLQPLLRRGGHRIERLCPPDLTVETNPGALSQVVTNLITNAVIHGFAPDQPGLIRLTVARTDEGICLDVEDDGRGIAAADLGQIFDPFFTTARGTGSTGLGMHIVHNLVTATLKGRIGVGSEPGRGTAIRISFPTETSDGSQSHLARPRAKSA